MAKCQEWADRIGWDTLIAWASGQEKGKKVPLLLRKYAISTLLAYGYGRPREALQIITETPSPSVDLEPIDTNLMIKFIESSNPPIDEKVIAGKYPEG